ncbi:MAG: sigma-54-dependent Fis family transcriptional regulator, partial [Deltaproteobacteria bacterium]|nr:sigma-54-dependent Fis family transcriptional regulator [Deltaproteobacteria bacterium]
GDLAQELQAKLLRVLEDREYERVGGMQTLRMRARVVAASSRNLFPADTQGAFRTDLYFRLCVFHIELPPLRERTEDLPRLVQEGLDRLCARQSGARPEVSDGFLARLARHDWPGNVRELMNTLERVLARNRGGPLQAGDIDDALLTLPTASRNTSRKRATENAPSLRQEIEDFERREILGALEHSGGNVAGAARQLCIPRGTLRHKIRKHSLRGASYELES